MTEKFTLTLDNNKVTGANHSPTLNLKKMKYKQIIVIPERISAGIFNLPCVASVEKGIDGSPVYRFKERLTSPRGVVAHSLKPGDILAEDHDGKWFWLRQDDYQAALEKANTTNPKREQVKNIIEQARKNGKTVDWATIVLC